jgi:hypothetical protein
MTEKEQKLAAMMLRDYAEIIGNRCCNDFYFPAGWDTSEMTAFVKQYHEYNGDPEEYEIGNTRISDFCAAALLAKKLNGDTK